MNVAVRAKRRMRVPDFIEMIRPFPDEERWELLDGEPVLMAPQTVRHQQIVGNLMERLGPAARKSGCRALPGLGMLHDEIDDYAPIPDFVVRCGPVPPGSYANDPVMVAEVLSPSTMDNDRGRKLAFYKAMPTLRTLLIVYQDEVRIEAWERGEGEGPWTFRVLKGLDEALAIPALATELPLAAVYEDVPLSS